MPTAQELRGALRRRVRRVRGDLWGILQTTVAAGAAWFLANLLHPQPFFAPAAAVIAMGVSRGGRTVRAIELVVGVAVGIVVADVIVRWLGANTLVLMLVVGLSMAAALLFGAGQILVNQAAISGILVVATLQPGSSPSPARALDALIGGAVALLVGQVLFPRDPVRAMAKAARPVVSDLSVALKALAEALRDGDEERARRALEIAREHRRRPGRLLRRGRAGARDLHPAPAARAHARARAALRRGRPADGLRRAQHARARPPCAERDPPPRARAARSWPTPSRCSATPCSSSATSSSTPSRTPPPGDSRSRPP